MNYGNMTISHKLDKMCLAPAVSVGQCLSKLFFCWHREYLMVKGRQKSSIACAHKYQTINIQKLNICFGTLFGLCHYVYICRSFLQAKAHVSRSSVITAWTAGLLKQTLIGLLMSLPAVKRSLEAVKELKLKSLWLYFCGQYKELKNMITKIFCKLKLDLWERELFSVL